MSKARPKLPGPVRMRPETWALFEEMHRQLNAQLPFGAVTKVELMHACVSSASAAMAEGRFHIGSKQGRGDDQAA